MKKIPCKKCPKCGLYHDFTIVECDCGEQLGSIEAKPVNTAEISKDEYGQIDRSLKVYVQKCSACGALNYTDDPSHPVKMCYNCHKTRIAGINPVEWSEGGSDDDQKPSTQEAGAKDRDNAPQSPNQAAQVPTAYAEDDEDDYDDEASLPWQSILKNVQKKAGTKPPAKTSQPPVQQVTAPKDAQPANDFDDEDDEVCDWSGVLGMPAKASAAPEPKPQNPRPPAKRDITLSAIRYGRLSFTVEAGQDSYMLGRSANQGEFLSQDGRVGNEHCYLFFRNGTWYVRDNHSKNGTAVNSRDIGLDGECILNDGDELKLGHKPDSVTFRISIK